MLKSIIEDNKKISEVNNSKILACYDGSKNAGRALDEAIKIATVFEGILIVLNVLESKDTEGKKWQLLDDIEGSKLMDANVDYELRMEESKEIAQTINMIAEVEGFDLIVIGKKGNSVVHTRPYGSITEKVLSTAPCSVLIIP